MSDKKFPLFTVLTYALLIIALVIETFILVQQSAEFEKFKNATTLYKSISVYQRDSDVLAGTVSVIDGELSFTAFDSKLETYLNTHLESWKTQEFEYEMGGEQGVVTKKTRLGEQDFLLGLSAYFENEVKRELFNAYYFDLVTACTK